MERRSAGDGEGGYLWLEHEKDEFMLYDIGLESVLIWVTGVCLRQRWHDPLFGFLLAHLISYTLYEYLQPIDWAAGLGCI